MSSGGGGKGGGKKTTTETTVPEWIRAPAERNLQRAEALQQIEYMPYYGAEVAAFNPNQEMAFQNNANTAAAFGLLAPTDAMAGMPTPTTYDNGMKGYSSIPIYDQAKKDLAANYGDTVDAYDSLFGNAVPALVARQTPFGGGGGGGGGGGVTPRPSPSNNFTPNYDVSTWSPELQVTHAEQISPTSTVSESDNAYRNLKPTRDYSSIKNQISQERAAGVGNYGSSKPKSSVKKYTATNNPRIGGRYGL
jgi:hypothetical protein